MIAYSRSLVVWKARSVSTSVRWAAQASLFLAAVWGLDCFRKFHAVALGFTL